MYQKYNHVLRFFGACDERAHQRFPDERSVPSDPASPYKCVPFISSICEHKLHLGSWVPDSTCPHQILWQWDNTYTTTMYAINSAVMKLSKLTHACLVYRGSNKAQLPEAFFRDIKGDGVRGGVEFGFTSTTRDRAQAFDYAGGDDYEHARVSIIYEMALGMTDRGCDMEWISQYPHEKEILLPPLVGFQAVNTRVERKTLVVELRPSLNLNSPTLEKVIGKMKASYVQLLDIIKGSLLADAKPARDPATGLERRTPLQETKVHAAAQIA